MSRRRAAGEATVNRLEPAAWAWAQHLRGGGTTPWSVWVEGGAGDKPPPGWQVPGAAQLEVVRRLAAAGRLHGERLTRVADLVLRRSGPGRGLAQQPLWWPGTSLPAYGAPPVDPARVPEAELLRVTVGVLVDLVLAGQVSRRRAVRLRDRLEHVVRPGPAVHVVGAPVSASVVRRELGLAEDPQSWSAPTVVLVAVPFDELLTEVWSARAQRGAAVRWPGFVGRWAGRSELPPSADLPALAAHWRHRVGADRVRVVVPDPGAGTATVGEVLGLAGSRRPRRGSPPAPAPLPVAAVEVVRRANAVLGVRVPDARHREVLPALVRAVATETGASARLTVPRAYRGWAQSRAERLVEGLSAAGYRVHGDLDALLPRFEGRSRPLTSEALRVALTACAAQAATSEGEDPA